MNINILHGNPRVSVVMSVYNEPEKWLRESIGSILKQTFIDFEFIIVNDNPDRVLNKNILNEFKVKDSRIIVITNSENVGLTKSLNKGLDIARGEFIARMDGDDLSLPRRLQDQYDFMIKNPNIGVCGTYIKYIGDLSRDNKEFFVDSMFMKGSLILENPLPHPTAFIRHSILQNHGVKYAEEFLCAQDYKLWTDLAPHTEFANIPSILVKYRVQKDQVSQKNNNKQKGYAIKIKKSEVQKYLGSLFWEFERICDKRRQFNFILDNLRRSHRRSFLLLSIFLSYKKLSLFDCISLIMHVHFQVLVKKRRLIIWKMINHSRDFCFC